MCAMVLSARLVSRGAKSVLCVAFTFCCLVKIIMRDLLIIMLDNFMLTIINAKMHLVSITEASISYIRSIIFMER